MQIVLNLTEQAAHDFAAFYGHEAGGVADFVTSKLLERITGDLEEKRNMDALVAAQAQPVVVTEDA